MTDLVNDQHLRISETDAEADKSVKEGNFLLCICDNSQGGQLIKDHPNFVKLDPHKIAEGSSTASSFANLAMPTRVAHPSAAQLYINWLLSQSAELAAAKSSNLPSMRKDVPTSFLPAVSIPAPGWPSGSNQSAEAASDEAISLATKLLGKP